MVGMVSYFAYKVLHLSGLTLLLLSLGGMAVLRSVAVAPQNPWSRRLSIMNGAGLLVLLVAGFGLLARLDASWPWQGWVLLKLLIWVFFAALMVLVNRIPRLGQLSLWLGFAAVVAAAYLANYKPF